jgi:hypothetical protein
MTLATDTHMLRLIAHCKRQQSASTKELLCNAETKGSVHCAHTRNILTACKACLHCLHQESPTLAVAGIATQASDQHHQCMHQHC